MAPHPGLHVCCPVCEGPIPDLLGELTDEPVAVMTGSRATDCYYCGTPLLCPGLNILLVGPGDPPPARRTAARRDMKFGGASGVDAWRTGAEQALQDDTAIPVCRPLHAPIWSTNSANKLPRDTYG